MDFIAMSGMSARGTAFVAQSSMTPVMTTRRPSAPSLSERMMGGDEAFVSAMKVRLLLTRRQLPPGHVRRRRRARRARGREGQLEGVARHQRVPALEQLRAALPDPPQLVVGQHTRDGDTRLAEIPLRILHELRRRPSRAARALGVQLAHEPLTELRVRRQVSARSSTFGVGDGPALIDEPEEGVRQAELGLDAVVGEIVQRKEGGVGAFLLLPGLSAVLAGAFQDSAAICALRDENPQHAVLRSLMKALMATPMTQSYSSLPCTQMKPCRSIMSRGPRSL